jgi:putative hemolysin
VGGATAIAVLTPWLAGLGLPGAREWATPVALGIVILLITYVSLVIGELVPKAVALRNPERIACLAAPPILWLSRIASAPVGALTASTRAVLRVIGQGKPQESPFVSEEEVRYLIREGAAKGIFEKVEEELVHNVFKFAETTVRAIMVPRPNILGLDVTTPAGEVLSRAASVGHSRVPVYRDSIEQPVGVVAIKDLLRAAAAGVPPALGALMRVPLFVPENARISALLREFQRSRQDVALVVDEHGVVVGLVSLEDVLEEIVGEIHEPGETATAPFATPLPEGAYILSGLASVRDVRERLQIAIRESTEYSTVAGLLLHALQTVPTIGTSVGIDGYRWTVVEMQGPRIVAVRVESPDRGGGQ